MKLSPGWQRILFNTICYDTKKVAKNVYIPTSALKPNGHTMLVRTIYLQKFYTVPLFHTCRVVRLGVLELLSFRTPRDLRELLNQPCEGGLTSSRITRA